MPTIVSRPPETTLTCTLQIEATTPDSSSPSDGPVAHTAMPIPSSRPRIESSTAACRMVIRKMPLTMSPAPASVSIASESHSVSESPNATMAAPQTTTAIMIARP